MHEPRYRFSPTNASEEVLAAGVWLSPEGVNPSLATWWPQRLHRNVVQAAWDWTDKVDGRLYGDNPPVDALRLEYLAKLAEFSSESARLKLAEREAFIERSIPPGYRVAIDRIRLKSVDAFDLVQLWKPSPARPGLVAFGDTGRGKTLAVYHRLAALHRARGMSFVALTADTLKRRAIAAAMHEGDGLEDVWKARVLFIDDLSQAKLTAHYAETLFAIVEHRTAQGMPCIFTVQMTKAALIRKLAGYEAAFLDTAECLARRIEDHCQPVNFGRNGQGVSGG